MRLNDAVFGLLLMVLSAWLFTVAEGFRGLPGVPYGPKVFPQVVCAVLFGAGLLLTVKGLREWRLQPLLVLDGWARSPRAWLVIGTLVGGLLFYIFAVDALGFLITASLVLMALLAVSRERGRLLSSGIVAVTFPVVVHFVFARLLRVPLPDGLLTGLL